MLLRTQSIKELEKLFLLCSDNIKMDLINFFAKHNEDLELIHESKIFQNTIYEFINRIGNAYSVLYKKIE